MGRALELAALGRGRTAPNPPVGAVVARDGQIVGEGYHVAAGTAHAETIALAEAGPLARDATLYVTLEPCCHHGRTPPCTEAIIAAGVAEVWYAVGDPDPRVAGSGHRALVAAGIRVEVGESEAAAGELLRGYLLRHRRGRPWVTAKFAMSLDGKIATHSGDARWISGEASRAHGHVLRDRSDAVIVGIGTVLVDDPRLTVRPMPADGRQPHRIVVDTRLRMPLDAALAGPELAAGTTVAFAAAGRGSTSDDAIEADRLSGPAPALAQAAAALEDRGLGLLGLPPDRSGRVNLRDLLAALGRRGYNEVLVEGGGELLAGFFALGLIDEVEACVAPLVIGGRGANTPVGGIGVERIDRAGRFEIVDLVRRDRDVWIVARPAGPPMEVANV
ncbi:MAG: bifunctional diaminohydroxyphosphoribosylaminopyrimidine deaminase/5-amino-6-(5-phosphoribosylamino)uracil reductase RibD [Chloroflexi bacterium]|nr:bifunctional diaminohydroxyphosphoribosylaminopyrimidine deaminase/5-amino-6-(5-phosphoribosylamino)uracil reductase RibD [Chloroflexota bacterium]